MVAWLLFGRDGAARYIYLSSGGIVNDRGGGSYFDPSIDFNTGTF
jgi:hypothetical protein